LSYKCWVTVLQLQFFSIVLQGVADSESRFIFTDKGVYGKQSDGGTFSASTLYHFLEDSKSTLPSLQILGVLEQKCPSSSLEMKPIL
jgi:hypothetical protein